LPRYRSKGSFAAWLFTIAHARLVDHYRKDSRKADQEIAIENVEIPAKTPELLSQAVQKSEIEQLFKLMNKLKEKEKTLLQLRFMAELSYQEIGQVLHCKEDTARKATARLLKKLKTKMEDDHDEIL
jgi:RNA polymerase sigma-70 factor (ECF subfamily)